MKLKLTSRVDCGGAQLQVTRFSGWQLASCWMECLESWQEIFPFWIFIVRRNRSFIPDGQVNREFINEPMADDGWNVQLVLYGLSSMISGFLVIYQSFSGTAVVFCQ
jgi:hypothetical protein